MVLRVHEAPMAQLRDESVGMKVKIKYTVSNQLKWILFNEYSKEFTKCILSDI